MSTSTSHGAQIMKNATNKNLPASRAVPILKSMTNKNLPVSHGAPILKNNVTNKNLPVSHAAPILKNNVTNKNLPIKENRVKTARNPDVGKSKIETKNSSNSNNVKSCTSSNTRTLTERRNVKAQIEKWRADRQARLAARILKNNTTKCEVSSSLFGTATPCITVERKMTVNHNSRSQQARQVNTTVKKKSTIEVRQTTASRLRMNKLNPLHGILSTTRAPSENMKTPTTLLKPSNSTKLGTNCPLPNTGSKLSEKQAIKKRDFLPVSSKQYGPKVSNTLNAVNKMETLTQKKETNNLTRRNLFQVPSSAKSVHKVKSVCRSRSVSNIASMSDDIMVKFESEKIAQCKTTINPLEVSSRTVFLKPDNQLMSSDRKKSKGSLFTPDVNRKSIHMKTPHRDILRERLVNWLAKRGKPIETYRHLCCFGQPPDSKKKALQIGTGNENVSPNLRHQLVHDKPIKHEISLLASNEVDKSFNNKQSQLKKVLLDSNETVENILSDLRMLVISGYPRDQCEAWLHLIMKEYENIDERAVYWECLAALEEARGDYNTAVDYYGRAIMRGAKTDNVDKSLESLWQKFNTLNLDCKSGQNLGSGKKSTNKLVDPCQMFKSTVIKFALQQKAVKQISANLGVEPSSLQYVATPVRRSTRKSVCQYKASSNIECVSTLQNLQPDVKNSIVFHTNRALTPKV